MGAGAGAAERGADGAGGPVHQCAGLGLAAHLEPFGVRRRGALVCGQAPALRDRGHSGEGGCQPRGGGARAGRPDGPPMSIPTLLLFDLDETVAPDDATDRAIVDDLAADLAATHGVRAERLL